MITFETMPVEVVADIMSELNLESLINISAVSRKMRAIASDPFLNPWRVPIFRNLRTTSYEHALKHLSVRQTVPRQNWIEILSLASPSFILFEATLPNLMSSEWEECFSRRFLPGWMKWKKDGSTWKEAFIKLLHRVWHRSHTSCTWDESWTKYIVLNRNGSANLLEASSRTFHPLVLFNEMKLQSNLAHLETRVRLVVELADIRILAFGTLNRPRSHLTVNPNAHIFLHPPGVETEEAKSMGFSSRRQSHPDNLITDHGVYPLAEHSPNYPAIAPITYDRLTHPLPALTHMNYPWHTPGGGDKRWLDDGEAEEEGLQWVGRLMIIAQIMGPNAHELSGDWLPLQDLDLVVGPGRQQYTSFIWEDLSAIAPWMDDRITMKIDGPGLGI